MAKALRKVSRFDVPVDRLLSAVTDPELVKGHVRPGTSAGTSVREVSNDGKRLVQELISQEYARTMTGGLDKSKTERSVTSYDWDLPALRCTWSWKGGSSERVRIAGRIALRSAGTGCELDSEFEFEVKVPLMGGVIEKMIAGEIEADLPRFDALVREHLARKA